MRKVLVLEDEANIRGFIVINLRRAGYEVIEAESGEEALEKLKAQKDIRVALLDVMLPGIDGFEVCRRLRAHDATIGIIMLTARVDALMRRSGGGSMEQEPKEDELSSPPFVLNLRKRTLEKNGERVKLTQVEFGLMKLFMENPGKALSREEILDTVWGHDYFGELKIVDVNIRRLRLKIEDDTANPTYIITVWGYGYKWGE